MGRLLMIVGVVLMVASFGLLFYTLAEIEKGDENSQLGNLLESLYCDAEEEFRWFRGSYSYNSVQRTGGRSIAFRCEIGSNQRDVTPAAFFTIAGFFVVPFLLGLFLTMFLMMRGARRRIQSFTTGMVSSASQSVTTIQPGSSTVIDMRSGTIEQGDLPPQTLEMLQNVLGGLKIEMPAGGQGDFTTRLKQLQEAYDQGLISREEYDKTRQAILDRMDD